MRRCSFFFVVLLMFLLTSSNVRAQDIFVPAGTILKCTMNEPNFSSATVQVGDPVLCHLSSVQEFGRNAFPRGAYMSGHLEADKEPGHFWGKGYLRIVFDRIGTPNSDVTVDTKVIAAKGYKVDKEGDIKGKGHATRDVVEWMIPPLWPWKVLMLPARGPRPTLKGEETITMRLMEDVTIPRIGAAYNSRDWRPAPSSYKPAVYYNDTREMHAPPTAMAATHNVISVDSGFRQASQNAVQEAAGNVPQVMQLASEPRAPVVQGAAAQTQTPSSSLTLIALRNETIYAVASYWLDGDNLGYVLPSGARASCALNDVDLARTTQLNSERGISISFREAPAAQPVLSSVLN
ncbi:MAG TPA: hypothetical protein VN025_11675 [Candidatus Dormibacteraeota bacterium]|jgi:hypothetical protein|nr:hypothetical protein [Candidatus Dormibacteraeota bacterium]